MGNPLLPLGRGLSPWIRYCDICIPPTPLSLLPSSLRTHQGQVQQVQQWWIRRLRTRSGGGKTARAKVQKEGQRGRHVPESLTIFRKGLKTHLFRVHLDCIATLPLLATIVHCVVLYCIIVLNCVATAVAAIMAVTRGMS